MFIQIFQNSLFRHRKFHSENVILESCGMLCWTCFIQNSEKKRKKLFGIRAMTRRNAQYTLQIEHWTTSQIHRNENELSIVYAGFSRLNHHFLFSFSFWIEWLAVFLLNLDSQVFYHWLLSLSLNVGTVTVLIANAGKGSIIYCLLFRFLLWFCIFSSIENAAQSLKLSQPKTVTQRYSLT